MINSFIRFLLSNVLKAGWSCSSSQNRAFALPVFILHWGNQKRNNKPVIQLFLENNLCYKEIKNSVMKKRICGRQHYRGCFAKSLGGMTSEQCQEWPKESNMQRSREWVSQAGRTGSLSIMRQEWAWHSLGTERRLKWLKVNERKKKCEVRIENK